MKFHMVFMIALPFLLWKTASQNSPKGSIDSPHITGGRHYWHWVSACSEWAVQSQDRYFCTMEGKIVCKEGWSWNMCSGPMCAYLETPATFCSKPKCSEGCDPVHGHCEVPNTCKCKVGYKGDNCTEMLSLRSCQNGIAMSAEEPCVCNTGWTGDRCNIPECKEGCSTKNGYCTEPNDCLCQLGWTGEDCTDCVPYPGCDTEYGSCEEPWQCKCSEGWTGHFCNETLSGIQTHE